MDGGAIFGIIPKALWSEVEKSDEQNRIELASRSLLIQGNNKKILVETGLDKNFSDRMQEIYKVDFSQYSLDKSLQKMGIKESAITDVFLTHLHFDHCGGNVKLSEGSIKPKFPEATYHIQQKHWNWANSPSLLDRNSFIERHYQCLQEYNQLNLLEEEYLYEGLRIFTTNGHTPGQQQLLIEDSTTPLFFGADLLPFRWSAKEPWISSFELNSLEHLKEKKKFLARAKEGNWRVVFTHDPQEQTGQIKQGDKYHQSYNFKSNM